MRQHQAILAAVLVSGCFSESPPSTYVSDDDDSVGVGESSTTEPVPQTSGAVDPPRDDPPIDGSPSGTTGGGGGGDDSTSGGVDPGTSGEADGSSSSESSGGGPVGIEDVGPGDLVITELMWNPGCAFDHCEWAELYNASGNAIDLRDLVIQDQDRSSANQGRVSVSIVVEPAAYVVIALTDAGWPYEFEPAALYGPQPQLTNGSVDQLVILNTTDVIDETATHLFPSANQGISWALAGEPDALGNDDSLNWCDSLTELPLAAGGVEYGTPGAPNDCSE